MISTSLPLPFLTPGTLMMPGVRDDSFEVVNPGFAEAIADGVGAPTDSIPKRDSGSVSN